MLCDCFARVDPKHVRASFANIWLKDIVTTSEFRALTCYLCEQRKNLIASKKKSKMKSSGIFLFRKTKDETDMSEEHNMEELFMCLTCTRCFCFTHVRTHNEECVKTISTSNNGTLKSHFCFFGVIGGLQTPGRYTSSRKSKTIFPVLFLDEYELKRKGGCISLGEECTLPFMESNNQRAWAFHVWCTCCSEKPTLLRDIDYVESRYSHVCVKALGDIIARLLYLFYLGIRVEISQGDFAFPQASTRSAESLPHVRSVLDVHSNRSGRTDGNEQAGSNVLTGTSSTLFRTSKGELECIAAAHISGIENTRNTCYFNSVLQCVLKCRLFTRPLLNIEEKTLPGPLTRRLCAMLRHLREETVTDLQMRSAYPFARDVLEQLCEIAPTFGENEQQDCQELFLSMINGVADEFDKDKTLEERRRNPRISFEGVMLTKVVCKRCGSQFPREEVFMALSVPVEDSIESGLHKLFRPMHLQGKDQYACEVCFKELSRAEQERHNAIVRAQNEKKEKAKKKSVMTEEKRSLDCVYSDAVVSTAISRLGGTLALHLLRFQYDGRDFQKVTRSVSFPMSLDLTPFVTKDVLQEYGRIRALSVLHARFPSIPHSILLQFLDSANCDLPVAERLLSEAIEKGQLDEEEYEHTRISVKNTTSNNFMQHDKVSPTIEDEGVRSVSSTFSAATVNDMTVSRALLPMLKRELVGIVTHRGSLHGGHYVAYVRDDHRPNYWFRCDDEDVDRVDRDFVLQFQAEVYMLFYE